jgi:hypothetical protein
MGHIDILERDMLALELAIRRKNGLSFWRGTSNLPWKAQAFDLVYERLCKWIGLLNVISAGAAKRRPQIFKTQQTNNQTCNVTKGAIL